MNLYHLAQKESLLSIRATAESFPVNDICWCPDNATVRKFSAYETLVIVVLGLCMCYCRCEVTNMGFICFEY
jgi:hypothetical protein